MLNNVEIIVMVPIFIILLVVVFKPIKTAFNLDTFPSCVLSVCVSALCIIGISCFLKGSPGVILLPYAALGITIVLMVLVSFFYRCLKKRRNRSCDQLDKRERGGTNNKNIRKQSYKRKGYLR